MGKEHKLPYTAEDIEERLTKAGTMPGIARVGQYLRVKEVDENGKIKDFEAVDINAELPVAYLYNGVELPPLPEWDKEEYPYVYIAHRVFTTYDLYIAYNTKEKLSINSAGSGDTDGISNTDFKCNVCRASSSDNYAWGAWEDFVGGAYPPVWSNYDVLSLVDGSVYLAASDPVPVYAEEDKQKVIDLDTYGDTPVSVILNTLMLSGGGQSKATGIDKLFADLDTEQTVVFKFTVSDFGEILVYGATIVKESDGGVAGFSFECVTNFGSNIIRVTAIMNCKGDIVETIATLPLPV